MTNDDMSPADASKQDEAVKPAEGHRGGDHQHGRHHGQPKRRFGGRLAIAGAAVALLAVGGGVGATAVANMRPAAQMAPMTPVAVAAMKDDSIVTLKGTVAEVFGAKFVLSDGSGRALIETGRAGQGGKLVQPNEAIIVQGRFDDGVVKAAFLVRADGKTEAIGGFGPKHGKGGPKHGFRDGGPGREGPDRGGPAGDERGPDGKL